MARSDCSQRDQKDCCEASKARVKSAWAVPSATASKRLQKWEGVRGKGEGEDRGEVKDIDNGDES